MKLMMFKECLYFGHNSHGIQVVKQNYYLQVKIAW